MVDRNSGRLKPQPEKVRGGGLVKLAAGENGASVVWLRKE